MGRRRQLVANKLLRGPSDNRPPPVLQDGWPAHGRDVRPGGASRGLVRRDL